MFVFRRGTGLAAEHDRCTTRLLDVNLGSAVTGVFFTEQYGLSLAAAKLGLASPTVAAQPQLRDGQRDPRSSGTARTSCARLGSSITTTACGRRSGRRFSDCLQATHPAVADWLEPLGPLKNEAPIAYRAVTKVLRKRGAPAAKSTVQGRVPVSSDRVAP